jgi:hypothetical protein
MATSEPIECQILRRTLDALAQAQDLYALGDALQAGLATELARVAARLVAKPDDAPARELCLRARSLLTPLLGDERVYEVRGEGWGAPAVAYGITLGELASQALSQLPPRLDAE